MTTADRIKQRRLELGLTQLELAKRLGFSTKAAVSKIENQGDKVTLRNVEKFALALHCAPSYLMGWSDEKYDGPEYEDYHKTAYERTMTFKVIADYSGEFIPKTENEKEIIDLFSQLTEEQQQLVRNTMKAFLQKQ
jgi:transcriptional regulator with XRE-family HTH domain